MAQPTKAAYEHLVANPHLWREYKDKYGSLPDTVKPPPAPAAALEFVTKNPDTAPDFETKYGYSPSPVAPVVPSGTDPALAPQALTEEEPSTLGNIGQLAKRSGARLVEGVASLGRMGAEKIDDAIKGGVGITPGSAAEQTYDDFSPMRLNKAVFGAVEDKSAQWEKQAVESLSPDVRAGIEKNLVERDEAGALRMGEGGKDAWWWTANAIDMGVMMAPGIGTAGAAARISYATRYGTALAETAARKMPQSLAIQFARKEAEKAATTAAVLAGGLVEGTSAGGLNASQTEQTLNEIDEQALLAYEPYRMMRDQGLSHEVARAKIARDRGFAVGLATAAVTGLTGAPLNAWVAKWATKTNPTNVGRLATAAKGVGAEGAQEFVQEGAEQVISNKGEQPITGKDTWDSVLENAITGAVLGGALGGAGGLAAGSNAPGKGPVKEPAPDLTEQPRAEYDRTKAVLEQTEAAAADPSIRIPKADLDKAREEHQQSMIALGQSMLSSGKLDAKQQQAFAQALKQAEAAGVKPKVAPAPIEGKVNDDGKSSVQPADKPKVPAASKDGETKSADVLTEVEASRKEALNRIATADSIEPAVLNDLIANKLARANSTGAPLLTPLGRRQLKGLADREAAIEAAKTVKPSDGKTAKPKSEKASVAGTTTEKPAVAAEKATKSAPVAKKTLSIAPAKKAAIAKKTEAELAEAAKVAVAKRKTPDTAKVAQGVAPSKDKTQAKAFLKADAEVTAAVADVQKDEAFTEREQAQALNKEFQRDADVKPALNQKGEQDIARAEVENEAAAAIEAKSKEVPDTQMSSAFKSAKAVADHKGELNALRAVESGSASPEQIATLVNAKHAKVGKDGKVKLLPAGKRRLTVVKNAPIPTTARRSEASKAAIAAGAKKAPAKGLGVVQTGDKEWTVYSDRAPTASYDNVETAEADVQAVRKERRSTKPEPFVGTDRRKGAPRLDRKTEHADLTAIRKGSASRGALGVAVAAGHADLETGRLTAAGVKRLEELNDTARVNVGSDRRQGAASVAASRNQIETSAFKKWFKGSRAVDANGLPLHMFHGTRAKSDFSEFDTTFETYFTSDASVAGGYTDPESNNGAGRILPVYLSIKNPLVIEGRGAAWNQLPHPEGGTKTTGYIAEWAKENGYDGVHFRDIVDNFGGVPGSAVGKAADVWAIFDPKQVKSASGNNGNFDPESADITARTGTGRMNLTEGRKAAASVAAQIRRELGVDVKVADYGSDLPRSIRDALGTPQSIKGAFQRHADGTTEMWIVAGNNADRQDMYVTALHEVVGHDGLRALLGDSYSETMREIRRSFPEEVRAAARRNKIDWTHADPDTRQQLRNLAAEELVAYSTEIVLRAGALKRERSLYARVVAIVRAALRKIGFTRKMSHNDISDLILRARDHVRDGRAKRLAAQMRYEGDMSLAASKQTADAIQFVHFSNLSEPEVMLDPKKMGTGFFGRERLRNPMPQISLYPDTITRETAEQELRGKTMYTVRVHRDALYDASTDPLKLKEKAQVPVGWAEEDGQRVPNRFAFSQNEFEKLVVAAGYDGFITPLASGIMQGQARLFKSYPAWKAGQDDGTAGRISHAKGARLLGMPAKAEIPGVGAVNVGPFEPAREASRAYREQMGIDNEEVDNYVRVNPKFAKRVADAFEKMKHTPNNAKVKAAYDALIDETLAQYQAIKATGLKVSLMASEGDNPYAASPRMAIEDVKNNNHIWIYPTDVGYGNSTADRTDDNPMLRPTSEKINGRTLLANDVFRIVHDYFGHVQEGNGFRADGEENAWRIHASMYSDLARAAMTTETRGQNSWLNYGPHGEKNRLAKSTETVYAPQKIGLLPREFWSDPSEVLSPKKAAAQKTIRRLAQYLTKAERRKLNTSTAKKVVQLFDQLPDSHEMAAVALAGQAKRGWYRKSAEAISNIFGPDAPRFAALLAALSPQTSVQGNLDNTVRIWAGWIRAGRPTDRKGILKVMAENVVGHKGGDSVLGAWRNNSVTALSDPNPESIMLSGPKVDSFMRNLRDDVNAVTLDTWMANYALVEQKIFAGSGKSDTDPGKGSGYLAYSARVRQTADHLTKMTGETWTPAEVQETVWSWAKALYEEVSGFGGIATARDIIENEELTDALINSTPDFATLFHNPAHERILRDAGYGPQLDELAGTNDESGSPGQKTPPLAGDRERLLAAADRLDKLRVVRGDEKAANAGGDIAFSVLGSNTGDPALDSFLEKVGGPKRTLKQAWDEFKTDLADKLALGVFDQFHGIKRAENLAGISSADSGYISARLSGNSAELTQAMAEYGHPIWDGGAPNVAGNQGLLDILKPLGDNVNLWLAYVVAKRADRLMGEGRENLFERNEINAALDLARQHPEFLVASQRYGEFQKKVLDFAQEAGIINPASRALWENADYVPFYRVIENGEVSGSVSGGTLGKIRNQIVQLRGGETNIGDPLENILKNWLSLTDASLKAVAARQTVDNLNGTGLVTRAPQFEFKQVMIPAAEVKKFIKNNAVLVQTLRTLGVDVNNLPPAAFQGLQQMLAVQAPTDPDVISIWRNGKREYWKIHDELLFQSLQGISKKAWGPLMEIFRFPKRLLTATVTSTPQFAVKNLWRDMWHAFVQGYGPGLKQTTIPGIDTVKGTISQLRMDAASQSMLAGGGSFTHGYIRAGDLEGSAATLRRTIRKKTVGGTVLNSPATLWGFYRDLLNASENSGRVAIYNRSLSTGVTRKEALFASRDMLDFSMRGANPVIQFLTESVPFMNARLQGMYRLGRGFKENFAAIAIRGLLITAASAAIFARNMDDERYKALTDDQKNSYWHFFDVFEEGDHWKLPKPFEVGTLFGSIPEAFLDAFITNADEPDAAKQSITTIGHAFANTLDMSPKIQAVMPILELALNRNTFTGAPVLTMGDEGVLPEDQDGPSVSPTYRALANAMPEVAPDALRSPKQLQHLGRGYLGSIQDYVLLVTDSVVRKARGEPSPPERATDDWPGLRDFRTIGPAKNTRYLNELYNIADEAEKVSRSVKRNEEKGSEEGDARAAELEAEKAPFLDVRKEFAKASDEINGLRQLQRATQLDKTMSPADKRIEINSIQNDINDIAKELWDIRPGSRLNPEVGADLIGKNTEEQAAVLQAAGLNATAKLLRLV
jgi:hypothetical protein